MGMPMGTGNGKATNGNGGGTAPITLNFGGATKVSFQTQADAPSCMDCGSIMVRNGAATSASTAGAPAAAAEITTALPRVVRSNASEDAVGR